MADPVPTWVDGSNGGTPLNASNLNQMSTAIRNLQADAVPCPAPTGTAATDTANIQNTINAATAGSTVVLQPGIYVVNATIQIPDHITLAGATRHDRTSFGTIIQVANSANLAAVIADYAWYNNSSGVGDFKRITNLAVAGNASNQASGTGIGIVGMSYRFEVDGVTVSNTRGDGIRLTNVNRGGTEATGTAVENRVNHCIVEDPGQGNLTSNADGVAIREGATGGSVTDGWIVNCPIYGTVAPTNGYGIYLSQAAGWLVSGNHIYGVGKDGLFITGASFTRIIGNYIEYYGQKASVGNVRGIYCLDNGTSGSSIVGNNINAVQPITGNTFFGMYLENQSSSSAYYALSANTMFSSSTSGGTGLRAVNNGSNSNFKISYVGQMVNGFATTVNIDGACDLRGDLGGWQNPSFSSTFTPDPGAGATIELVLTGNITINLPTTYPSGMRLTFVFDQDATGGRTVTWNSTQYKIGSWSPNTAASKTNTITFISDGFWLYATASSVGL